MIINGTDRRSTWFSSFIGYNAAMSAHGILLPLYLASLGGTTCDFGIITPHSHQELVRKKRPGEGHS